MFTEVYNSVESYLAALRYSGRVRLLISEMYVPYLFPLCSFCLNIVACQEKTAFTVVCFRRLSILWELRQKDPEAE
jgi:hypothetical protein